MLQPLMRPVSPLLPSRTLTVSRCRRLLRPMKRTMPKEKPADSAEPQPYGRALIVRAIMYHRQGCWRCPGAGELDVQVAHVGMVRCDAEFDKLQFVDATALQRQCAVDSDAVVADSQRLGHAGVEGCFLSGKGKPARGRPDGCQGIDGTESVFMVDGSACTVVCPAGVGGVCLAGCLCEDGAQVPPGEGWVGFQQQGDHACCLGCGRCAVHATGVVGDAGVVLWLVSVVVAVSAADIGGGGGLAGTELATVGRYQYVRAGLGI